MFILDMPLRFWAKIKDDPASGCWLWTGTKTTGGYAAFYLEGQLRHIPSLFLDVAEDQIRRHTCGKRNCVNPDHLVAITRKEHAMLYDGIAYRNANKSHCPHGHSYSGRNLVVRANRRSCRTCERIRKAKWYRKHYNGKKNSRQG